MKIKIVVLTVFAGFVGIAFPLRSEPLTESTFTEIVKDVNVVANASKTASLAQPNELLKAPDRVRTGADSRAELTAPDHTITRIGANTVFSFADSGRTLNLEQGNILFHAPHGIGGGTIKSGGAVAAVLGTTLIVSATQDGGFKVILLEGHGQATLPNGKSVTLHAGQMVFVLPGGTEFSAVLNINLGKLANGSTLIHGFSHEISSWQLIQAAIEKQNSEIASGHAMDTGISADRFAVPQPPGNGPQTIDHNSYQNAIHPPLNPIQYEQLQQGAQNSGLGGRGTTATGGGF
jgi:hypothetical protein